MSNEEIVDQIQNGFSVTYYSELLYFNNLPLIRTFLKPYIRVKPQDEPDLLQEAFLGLLDAVNHYKSDKGVLFMTYAEHWIKRRARAFTFQNNTVEIPSHFRQEISRYKEIMQEFQQLYGRVPSDLDMCKYMKMSLEEIKRVKIWMQDIKSLDDTVSCNVDSLTVADTIADDFNIEESVLDEQYKEYKQQALWDIVDRHTEPEQQSVIKKIYVENKTFQEISQENSISVDEVRKFKESGLKKLRSPKTIKEIREKLEILEESSIMYHSGINSFNNRGMSNIEYLAIKKATLKKFLE